MYENMKARLVTVLALTGSRRTAAVPGSRYSTSTGALASVVITLRSWVRVSTGKRLAQAASLRHWADCSSIADSKVLAKSPPTARSFGATPSITTARVCCGKRAAYCWATRVP
ncbi:hypothetical protein D9M71_675320 [compost metagenome]